MGGLGDALETERLVNSKIYGLDAIPWECLTFSQ